MKELSVFYSGSSQKGSGSIPDLMSQSTLHACLQIVNSMEISEIRNRPTCLLTWLRTKDAWFFASFEAYKMAGFLGRRENGLNAFRTDLF